MGSVRVSPPALGPRALGELLKGPGESGVGCQGKGLSFGAASEKAGCWSRSLGSRAKARAQQGHALWETQDGAWAQKQDSWLTETGSLPVGLHKLWRVMNCLGRWGGGRTPRIYSARPAILGGESLPHSNLI